MLEDYSNHYTENWNIMKSTKYHGKLRCFRSQLKTMVNSGVSEVHWKPG